MGCHRILKGDGGLGTLRTVVVLNVVTIGLSQLYHRRKLNVRELILTSNRRKVNNNSKEKHT